MPYYRRRRNFRRGSARKKIWVRDIVEAVTPVPDTIFRRDLLADFRTQAGLSINLPGFTLGPFKIKIGIRFDISVAAVTFTQDDGYVVGIVVDDINATAPSPLTSPNVDWAWYSWYPLSPPDDVSVVSTAAPTNTSLLRSIEIDAKSMRKIEEVGQTAWLVVEATGNAHIDEITEFSSVMARLP